MRIVAFSCTVALATLSALPAFAEMKVSKPAPAATPAPRAAAPAAAPAAPAAVAASADMFRPTNYLGVEKAAILDNGVTVLGLGGGLSLSMGINNQFEVSLLSPLTISAGVGSGLGLPTLQGKMIFINTPGFTVAGGVQLVGILTPTVFVPIGLGKIAGAEVTVTPMAGLPLTAPGGMTVGVAAGVEYPVMSKGTVEVSERLSLAPLSGAGALGLVNTLQAGVRVALTPNLTADVGGITLATGAAGNTLTLTAVSLSGSWGGRTSEMLPFFGF